MVLRTWARAYHPKKFLNASRLGADTLRDMSNSAPQSDVWRGPASVSPVPPVRTTVRTSVKLPADLWTRVRSRAAAEFTTLNAVVVDAIRAHLERSATPKEPRP